MEKRLRKLEQWDNSSRQAELNLESVGKDYAFHRTDRRISKGCLTRKNFLCHVSYIQSSIPLRVMEISNCRQGKVSGIHYGNNVSSRLTFQEHHSRKQNKTKQRGRCWLAQYISLGTK